MEQAHGSPKGAKAVFLQGITFVFAAFLCGVAFAPKGLSSLDSFVGASNILGWDASVAAVLVVWLSMLGGFAYVVRLLLRWSIVRTPWAVGNSTFFSGRAFAGPPAWGEAYKEFAQYWLSGTLRQRANCVLEIAVAALLIAFGPIMKVLLHGHCVPDDSGDAGCSRILIALFSNGLIAILYFDLLVKFPKLRVGSAI